MNYIVAYFTDLSKHISIEDSFNTLDEAKAKLREKMTKVFKICEVTGNDISFVSKDDFGFEIKTESGHIFVADIFEVDI